MRIRSKALCILWRSILLIAGLWGLLDGSGILSGAYTDNFPHMFTNISNMFAWAFFACALVHTAVRRDDPHTFAPFFKYTAMISLLVTMLIGHFMLSDALFQDGKLVLHLVVLHYIVPLMALFDWVLFDEKGRMPLWGPLLLDIPGSGLSGLFHDRRGPSGTGPGRRHDGGYHPLSLRLSGSCHCRSRRRGALLRGHGIRLSPSWIYHPFHRPPAWKGRRIRQRIKGLLRQKAA